MHALSDILKSWPSALSSHLSTPSFFYLSSLSPSSSARGSPRRRGAPWRTSNSRPARVSAAVTGSTSPITLSPPFLSLPRAPPLHTPAPPLFCPLPSSVHRRAPAQPPGVHCRARAGGGGAGPRSGLPPTAERRAEERRRPARVWGGASLPCSGPTRRGTSTGEVPEAEQGTSPPC